MASLPGHRRADEDADRGAAPACLPHPMALHGAAASPSVSDPNGWPQSGCRRDVEQGRGEFGPPHGDAPAASRAQSISHADSLAPERHASPQPPHWQRGRASRQGSASLHALRSADRLPAAPRAKRRYGPAPGQHLVDAGQEPRRRPTPWPGQQHDPARTFGHRPDRRSGQQNVTRVVQSDDEDALRFPATLARGLETRCCCWCDHSCRRTPGSSSAWSPTPGHGRGLLMTRYRYERAKAKPNTAPMALATVAAAEAGRLRAMTGCPAGSGCCRTRLDPGSAPRCGRASGSSRRPRRAGTRR